MDFAKQINDKLNSKYLKKNRYLIIVCLFLLISVLLEIFIFNYKHWVSVFNNSISYDTYFSEGFILNEDGTYTTTAGEHYIELTNISSKVKSSSLIIKKYNSDDLLAVPVSFAAIDDAHSDYYHLGQRTIYTTENRSMYQLLHLYGATKSLKANLNIGENEKVFIDFSLNTHIPLFFSLNRVIVVFCLILLSFLLSKKSIIYQIRYTAVEANKIYALIVTVACIDIAILYVLTRLNPVFNYDSLENQREYQTLTEAFLQGQVHLLEEPPQALIDCENPYDKDLRENTLNEAGVWYKWDHAYYNGHYYVYFGVVPVVLVYLPYYFLTGLHIANRVVIFWCLIGIVCGWMYLIDQLIRKYYKRLSIGEWILLSQLSIFGSGIIYMAKRPDIYTVPISFALMLGIWGTIFYFKAIKNIGYNEIGLSKDIDYKYIIVGSLLYALIAGCRPQIFVIFFIGVVVILPIFLKKNNFEKDRLITISLYIVITMLIIAIPLMLYNFVRFNSIADFGANYNLNFNDMTKRGWEWSRIPIGIISYIFHPIKFKTLFPFVDVIDVETSYLGMTIKEGMLGGLVFICPFSLMCPFALVSCRKIKKTWATERIFVLICLILSFVIISVDVNGAGIVNRYFGDFSLIIMLGSFIGSAILLNYYGNCNLIIRRLIINFLVFCLFYEIVYNNLALFIDTGEMLKDQRVDLYAKEMYQIAFWL